MLRTTTIRLPASPHPSKNLLPCFMEQCRHKQVFTYDTLQQADRELLGYECAPRFLPYRMQDEYQRANDTVDLQVIELENPHLKATFLPGYGGRLISLYHKGMQQELLYRNPVLQPANLAILDAWIAGGIEWNIGQYGHAYSTSSPVFCATVHSPGGEEFLRLYEYERTHGLFWQIDFHLPQNSEVLLAYVRIINSTPAASPLYYWTNIAVEEKPKTRVFSATQDVLYMDVAAQGFGRGTLPALPVLPKGDASYPQQFKFSCEYYFQIEKEEPSPWEVAVQPEGWMFFERSTQPLRYRKMFCWGTHPGGQHWKDYLSLPGQGDYMEIQAGLAPTQLHGASLAPHSQVEFVQCFGGMPTKHPNTLYSADWETARASVQQQLDAVLTAEEVEATHKHLQTFADAQPTCILHSGSGWGALEALRRSKTKEPMPGGLLFPSNTMGDAQAPWAALLQTGTYTTQQNVAPAGYLTGAYWMGALAASLQTQGQHCAEAYLQYGLMLAEAGQDEEAHKVLGGGALAGNAIALRSRGVLFARAGSTAQACIYYEKALASAPKDTYLHILREYCNLLANQKMFPQLWHLFETLPGNIKEDERVCLPAAQAALALGNLNFVQGVLKREFVHVRENATLLSDMWIELHRRKEEAATGKPVTAQESQNKYPVPFQLDFRMM